MGRADHFVLGDWNALCDHCGRKFKGSTLRKQWNNLWACPEHWEARQPQDFVRAMHETLTPPFVNNPADIYVAVCSPNGMTCIVGYAVVDCAAPDYISAAFDAAVS